LDSAVVWLFLPFVLDIASSIVHGCSGVSIAASGSHSRRFANVGALVLVGFIGVLFADFHCSTKEWSVATELANWHYSVNGP
jgi:hypothetical protein